MSCMTPLIVSSLLQSFLTLSCRPPSFVQWTHPPKTLLTKLEKTSLVSLVMMALVLDEAPDCILLVKNPRRYIGSLLHPSVLDGMVYSFTGPDAQNLAAVNILALALETTTSYNVLDDPATLQPCDPASWPQGPTSGSDVSSVHQRGDAEHVKFILQASDPPASQVAH